jgi:hypothetical protein
LRQRHSRAAGAFVPTLPRFDAQEDRRVHRSA